MAAAYSCFAGMSIYRQRWERDWQHKTGSNRSVHIVWVLSNKMAVMCETLEGRLLAVLDVLATGVYNNSFSKMGKRQTEEVHLFK